MKPVEDAGIVFQKVCVDADGKRILWDVSGRALPGQMLAVMGPSGEPSSNLPQSGHARYSVR